MTNVIPWTRPARRPLELAWCQQADAILQSYAGWLFTDGYGDPDVPGWLGDLWRASVMGIRKHEADPLNVNWERHWAAFVDKVLAPHSPEYRGRVTASLHEIETTTQGRN